jgi:hypothetical protein
MPAFGEIDLNTVSGTGRITLAKRPQLNASSQIEQVAHSRQLQMLAELMLPE